MVSLARNFLHGVVWRGQAGFGWVRYGLVLFGGFK